MSQINLVNAKIENKSLHVFNLDKFTMLQKIHHVKGIGLLHEADGRSHSFSKYTLIYAENGRGKSTLASVLRSCSIGDATLISNRKTLGGIQEPDVKCQFENGVQVLFTGGEWNQRMPSLLVFDTDFVEKNVYSGVQVRPDQRQGLLEFALGSQAINARNSLEVATQKARDAQGIVNSTEKELTGYRKSLSLDAFIALSLTENIDQKIETLRNRLTAARDKSTLQQKAIPKIVALPEIDLDRFFSILAKTLQDIDTDAEQKVISHIATHNGRGFEDWISQGHQYENNEDCPYCGQSLDANALIKAYRTHFNAAYIDLKQEIVTLGEYVELSIADVVLERFVGSVERSQVLKDSWKDYFETPDFTFDKNATLETLKLLRSILSSLVFAKQQSPLEHIGTESDKLSAGKLRQQLVDAMQVCNRSINISAESINRFKAELATENVQNIQQQIEILEHTKVRYESVVESLITRRKDAIAEKNRQDQAKITTKASLDTLMTQVLQQYSTQINDLLINFGASFQITPMGFSYQGGSGSPRSDYGLSLRGKEVNLSGTGTSFATALSEGDKRTLAFAFFIASIKADTNIASSIVVVDDPMCSLDRNRRQHTRDTLKDIGNKCSQLIVLGHDLYFLRDLHDDLNPEDGTSLPKLIKLGRVQHGYTNFMELKIDRECESAYYSHYRLLTEFVDGSSNNNIDLHSIAKAIRPMLEGYLHRRFPCRIKRSWMFGTILSEVGKAQSNDPLRYLESLVTELNSINRFAGKFHHDTNAAADTATVSDGELRIFAERALKVVHKGMP